MGTRPRRPRAFVLSRVYSVPRDRPRAHTLAAPRSARHTGRLQRLHPSRDQRARRPNTQWRRHPSACIVPAFLYWWRLPGFPFEHRRRRGLRVYLSPAFRGSRDPTAGREAFLLCLDLFCSFFLSTPCMQSKDETSVSQMLQECLVYDTPWCTHDRAYSTITQPFSLVEVRALRSHVDRRPDLDDGRLPA